jgi:hypothetical protein
LQAAIGEADHVAAIIVDDPEKFAAAVQAITDNDPVMRMRAADAVEKASRRRPELLLPHRLALLGPILALEQQEVRWHVLQMLPRLPLSQSERKSVFAFAESCLGSHGRIVAAEALSALFALAGDKPSLRSRCLKHAEDALDAPSPALRSRAKKLLK